MSFYNVDIQVPLFGDEKANFNISVDAENLDEAGKLGFAGVMFKESEGLMAYLVENGYSPVLDRERVEVYVVEGLDQESRLKSGVRIPRSSFAHPSRLSMSEYKAAVETYAKREGIILGHEVLEDFL